MRAAAEKASDAPSTTNPTLASLEQKAGELVGCEGMVQDGEKVTSSSTSATSTAADDFESRKTV